MRKLKSERPDILVEQFKLSVGGLLEFHPCSPEFCHCLQGIMSYKAVCDTKAAIAAREAEEQDEDDEE